MFNDINEVLTHISKMNDQDSIMSQTFLILLYPLESCAGDQDNGYWCPTSAHAQCDQERCPLGAVLLRNEDVLIQS